MRFLAIHVFLVATTIALVGDRLAAQEVVDRIVGRVENDVILLSDIRALSRYQQLLDGKPEADSQILERLVDQWIVRTEAEVSRSPHPSEEDIERSFSRLKNSFTSEQEFETRKRQAGLSDQDIRTMEATQLYLSYYLESRFRPSVQIDPKEIEDFYQNTVLPRAKARGQEPPTLEVARDSIQEALIQNGINEQADRWLKESRLRLHIEKFLGEGTK
jgi:hypothetical protein